MSARELQHRVGLPLCSGAAVVKSDATVIGPTRGIYVGGGGDLAVLLAEDSTVVTFTSVPAGSYFWMNVQKVMAATTATNILALK